MADAWAFDARKRVDGAARGSVLARLQRPEEARDAYARAIGLSFDPAVRASLRREIEMEVFDEHA